LKGIGRRKTRGKDKRRKWKNNKLKLRKIRHKTEKYETMKRGEGGEGKREAERRRK
jgi:hypothetical protein